MPVLAQHGFGVGSKISTAFEKGFIDGCIFSPKDIARDKLISAIADINKSTKEATLYFDPQYYATTIAQEPNAKLGYLASDYTDYFSSKTLRELRREKNVSNEAAKVIKFQKDQLNLSNIIAPNILIRDGLNSASSSISKNFLEICAEKANELSAATQTLLTLALDQSCFRNSHDLLDLVDEITGMNLNIKGFYIIVETSKEDGPNPWYTPEILAGQMYLAYALSQNGYEVVFGYSFLSAPYLWAAGANTIACGWFNTLRYFSTNRFIDLSRGGRKANRRYLSNATWFPMEWTQVQTLPHSLNLMNGLKTDNLYTKPQGDKRPNEEDEILQYWDTLKSKENYVLKAPYAEARIQQLLEDLKRQAVAHAGIRAGGRIPYSDEMLRGCQRSLALFAEFAEFTLTI